jgi:DNA-binding PadR family transcriptional regulator
MATTRGADGPSSLAAAARESIHQELRRGTVVIAVLAALREEQYGYGLRRILSEAGLEIDENTLYPLLRRLESQGLLESEWREVDRRDRRFYRRSWAGTEAFRVLTDDWRRLHAALVRILEETTS